MGPLFALVLSPSLTLAFALALQLAPASSLVAAGPGYAPIAHKDDVEVFAKEGASIELAAVGTFDQPPALVQAALLDYGRHPGLIKHLAESRVIEKHAGEMTVYEYLKLPVVKDRDYTLRVTWSEGAARGLQFAIAPNATAHSSKKIVPMTALSGRWDLEPIDGGKGTRATYHVTIDFGGKLSHGSVRDGAAKDLPSVFVGMRKLAAQHQSEAQHP